MPDITERLTIDGYTQQGASLNTLTQGTNAQLKIELDGTNAGSARGLHIASGGSGSVIKGLAISRFKYAGVGIDFGSTQNRVEGNFLGTDPGGILKEGNDNSVNIFESTFNTVGGPTPDKRNLISGNSSHGVLVFSCTVTTTCNRVEGNLIGTKRDDTTALANSSGGWASLARPTTLSLATPSPSTEERG